MTTSKVSLDVYHHAPAPHPNPVVGSLQIFVWLFFHSSAWCHYVTRLDATLRPDFCFAELQQTHWHNSRLRRQLLQSYGVWLGGVSVLILTALSLMGMPGHRVLLGVVFGMEVVMATSVVVGGVISVPGGVVIGVLGDILAGVARGVVGEGGLGTALSGLTSVMAGGIAGVGVSIVAAVASRHVTSPFSRQLGSVFIGLVIASVVTSIVLLNRPRVKVLLAGSHTLDQLQRWASYLINVQVLHISYLQASAARQLIERPVSDFLLRYEPTASQHVVSLTRCHPYLVQLLCAAIVTLKNEQPPDIRRLAQLADVEAAVPRALRHGTLFFTDIVQNQVDASGRALLQYVAAQGPGAVVAGRALVDTFPTTHAQTLALLTRRELLEDVPGGYRFQVELIRRWVTTSC